MNNIKIEIEKKFCIELGESDLRNMLDEALLSLNENIQEYITESIKDEYDRDLNLDDSNIDKVVEDIRQKYFVLEVKIPEPKLKKMPKPKRKKK